MPGEFNPQEIYAAAVKVNDKAKTEAAERKNVVKALYNAAVAELGYTDQQIQNNTDKQKEIVKLMFSEEYAGNEELNPLLGKSPMYKPFSEAKSEGEKQQMHLAALGINYGELVNLIDNRFHGFNEAIMQRILADNEDTYVTQNLEAYLSPKMGDSRGEKKKNYAALAAIDPNIASLDSNIVDLADAKSLATQSIQGKHSRESLDDVVGVTLPQYQKAA